MALYTNPVIKQNIVDGEITKRLVANIQCLIIQKFTINITIINQMQNIYIMHV